MSFSKFLITLLILAAILVVFFVPLYFDLKTEHEIKNFKVFKHQKALTTEDLNGQ